MMKDIDIKSLQNRIETMLPTLNEYQRRRFLSAEAQGIGYGGISLVSRLSGVSRQTLTEGVKELEDPEREIMPVGRSRKSGGGTKHVWEAQAGLLEALGHDFPIPLLGKATPYGVYDIFKNRGFVSVGISCDTAAFAVESVRKWWYAEGQHSIQTLQQS
jgi:hypothetical protein